MTKTIKKGFTIVELLIVIVVIGILAAIVLVTYQGVQNKANTTSAEQNARELISKATAFNAMATVYPTVDELIAAKPTDGDEIREAKLGEKVLELIQENSAASITKNSLPAVTSGTTKARIAYSPCEISGSRTGAIAIYWNYSDNKLAYVKGGETTGSSCAAAMTAMDATPPTAVTWPIP